MDRREPGSARRVHYKFSASAGELPGKARKETQWIKLFSNQIRTKKITYDFQVDITISRGRTFEINSTPKHAAIFLLQIFQ